MQAHVQAYHLHRFAMLHSEDVPDGHGHEPDALQFGCA